MHQRLAADCPYGVGSWVRRVRRLAAAGSRDRTAPIPEMKFNEVKEIAPGVFFRYSSISATDPKIPFGGSNNIWVVFKDYVVVIDANFPKEAGDVVAAIKKTTNKPIRYVLDTHHHGDHAYGNCVWAKEGAQDRRLRPTAPAPEDQRPEAVGRRRQGPQGHQRERTQAGRHHLRRQARPRRRHAARRVPCTSATATRSATRSRTCRSTRSSAPATPASTARSTSWAIPIPLVDEVPGRRWPSSTST